MVLEIWDTEEEIIGMWEIGKRIYYDIQHNFKGYLNTQWLVVGNWKKDIL